MLKARGAAVVASALVTSGAFGCAHDRRCRGRSAAECAWVEAVGARSPAERASNGDQSGRRTTVELAGSTSNEWGSVERMLGKMAVLMADGMGADVTTEQARRFCDDAPGDAPVANEERGNAWFCRPAEDASIHGHELMLEVGSDGVVALSARPLTTEEATEAGNAAEARWSDWCEAPFRDHDDDAGDGAISRVRLCPLPGGPSLAIVTAPRDPAGAQWQLTLAVMPAG
jgi:hypothetical protein